MSPADFDHVRRLVRDRSAVALEPGKEYLVETRLLPLARREGLGSVAELVGRLRRGEGAALEARVVEAMLTAETSFFRDLTPFEDLRAAILPDLIRRRAADRRLDLWSAACSTGQEPFSLAMLLLEHFPQLRGWTLNILATDLSTEVLGRARSGCYNQIEVNRGLPAALLMRYFSQQGTTWRVAEEVRRMVEFRELNLARPWPPLPAMDLILLRNAMIYFEVETKRAILARVAGLLRPEGYLLLGSAETTYHLHPGFRRVEGMRSGVYQHGG